MCQLPEHGVTAAPVMQYCVLTCCACAAHLVLGKGDQRADHHSKRMGLCKRRKLEDQRLSSTCSTRAGGGRHLGLGAKGGCRVQSCVGKQGPWGGALPALAGW